MNDKPIHVKPADVLGTKRAATRRRRDLRDHLQAEKIAAQVDAAAAGIVKKIAALPAPSGVHVIVQRLVNETQMALDDYLESLADPDILISLRAAHDFAREALAAIESREGPR